MCALVRIKKHMYYTQTSPSVYGICVVVWAGAAVVRYCYPVVLPEILPSKARLAAEEKAQLAAEEAERVEEERLRKEEEESNRSANYY
jgi:hypothetical protein